VTTVLRIAAGQAMVGTPAQRAAVQEFLRQSHRCYAVGGTSYVALGVVGDQVWVCAGSDPDELSALLADNHADAAEVLKLVSFQ
jgi:hypothetical protein